MPFVDLCANFPTQRSGVGCYETKQLMIPAYTIPPNPYLCIAKNHLSSIVSRLTIEHAILLDYAFHAKDSVCDELNCLDRPEPGQFLFHVYEADFSGIAWRNQ